MHPSDIKIGQTEQTGIDLFLNIGDNFIEFDDISIDFNDNRTKASIDIEEASRTIENILLGIPIQAIYVDANNPDKWIILGRPYFVYYFYAFISGWFRLDLLEFLDEYNGMNFDEIPRTAQRRLHQTKFSIYIISQGVSPAVRLSLVKRIFPELNLRNCLKFQKSLLSIKGRSIFEGMINQKNFKLLKRRILGFDDLYLVLAFLQVYHRSSEKEIFRKNRSKLPSGDLIILFNELSSNVEYIVEISVIWSRGLKIINSLIGEDAFYTGRKKSTFNLDLFGISLVFFGKLEDKRFKLLSERKELVRKVWFEYFTNPFSEFDDGNIFSNIAFLDALCNQIIMEND